MCVGKRKQGWISCFGTTLIQPQEDRDIIAVKCARRLFWVIEVEGDSGGQPEGKIYRALGQLVCAVSEATLSGYERFLTFVVYGEKAANHLARARAAWQLGISGLVIGATRNADQWVFGEPPPRIN